MSNYINISKPIIKKEELKAVTDVLNSGSIVQGKKVMELENEFAKFCKTKYAVATNNGTSALHTALHSIGLKKDDEVITTPFTFVATANSILMAGAKPVFVDIDEKTYNLDPKKIQAAITTKTKALLVVNIYGQPVNYEEINKIAKKNKLIVVEDAAQSIDAEYKGKKSGSFADIACFSLYATKNIMCGEGGMITTNNNVYFEKARFFRQHGQDENKKYEYFGLGYNYRMMDLQAAIACVQLKRLQNITKQRQMNAQKYNRTFNGIKGLVVPYCDKNSSHVYHQYTLRITSEFPLSRKKFIEQLKEKGIQANIYYPIPLYSFPHLIPNGVKVSDFPVTIKAVQEIGRAHV